MENRMQRFTGAVVGLLVAIAIPGGARAAMPAPLGSAAGDARGASAAIYRTDDGAGALLRKVDDDDHHRRHCYWHHHHRICH